MRRFALTLALLSCTGVDRYRAHEAPAGSPITVLVPGYRGSFLYAGDRRVYLSPGDAFSEGKESLGTCAQGRLALEPGGPMTKFTIWPYVFDVYGDFMDWGDQHLPAFTAFGYDWRAPLPDTADRLCAFVGERQANVIAHSMGGLVTMLAVAKCPEKFRSVVFAGVPFGGAPGVFKDLFLGSPTNKNTALLSAEALWTFSATWQLMPRTDDFFVDEQGAQVTVPISEPATWGKWPMPCPARLGERLVDRTAMPTLFSVAPAKAMAVIGRGIPTTRALRVKGEFFDWDRPERGDGDGSVLTDNATPAFAHEKVFTEIEHVHLLDDDKVREAIEGFFK